MRIPRVTSDRKADLPEKNFEILCGLWGLCVPVPGRLWLSLGFPADDFIERPQQLFTL
jgi:hypothetical protein